jgi:transposase
MVVVDEEGQRRHGLWVVNRVDAIEEGLARIVLWLPDGMQVRVVSEGVRSLGAVLSQVVLGLGIEQWVVHPKALARYREVEGQPRKDDDTDAWLLARMCAHGVAGCRRVMDPRPEERSLARLERLHSQLRCKHTAALSQLRARLLEIAPEVLQKDWKGPKYSSKGMLAVLNRWPGLAGLATARLGTIEGVLRTASRAGSRCGAMGEPLKRLADRVRLEGDERQVISLELCLLVEELTALAASIAKVHGEIATRVAAHPIGVKLLAMPGVGFLTAAVDIGEILPMARNVSEGKTATYAGLTPLSRSSGKTSGRARVARGVNKHALHANYTSALAAIRVSSLDAAYYRKQLARHQGHPKPHVVALLALARQRMKVKYKLMTTDAVYDKEMLIASHLDRESKAADKQTRAA